MELLSTIFSVIFIIIFIVAIFFGSKWLTKRYSVSSASRHIKIIDRVTLGQDKSLAIAEVCGSKYFIGISGQQITLLKDLGDIELPKNNDAQPGDFSSIFGSMLKKQISDAKDRFSNRGGRL